MGIQEFNSLVLNNYDDLKPFAISLTRDQDVARDLCQETMYKAFAYRENYRAGTNIRAWLYTIMRNIFINQYRRDQRKKLVIETLKVCQDQYAPSPEFAIGLKQINQAIHNLPTVFKNVCLLYLEGYKYQEIAVALNEPLGTIKSRIHFAKKILQKQIDR